MKITGRYREGQVRRQNALDYINSQPTKTALAPDIIRDLGWEYVGGSARLTKMVKQGELSRVKARYRKTCEDGKGVNVATYRYTALVTVTRDAEDVAKSLAKNLAKVAPYVPKPVNLGQAKYRHNDQQRMAIAGQGGQGASSPRMVTALEAMA